MSALSEQDVIELKHGLGGVAEICRTFYDDLVAQGFSDQQAMKLVTAWVTAAVQAAGTGTE